MDGAPYCRSCRYLELVLVPAIPCEHHRPVAGAQPADAVGPTLQERLAGVVLRGRPQAGTVQIYEPEG